MIEVTSTSSQKVHFSTCEFLINERTYIYLKMKIYINWNCVAIRAIVFSVSTTHLIEKGLELKRLCMGPPWIQTPVTGPDESLQLGLDHDMGFHVFNLN